MSGVVERVDPFWGGHINFNIGYGNYLILRQLDLLSTSLFVSMQRSTSLSPKLEE